MTPKYCFIRIIFLNLTFQVGMRENKIVIMLLTKVEIERAHEAV